MTDRKPWYVDALGFDLWMISNGKRSFKAYSEADALYLRDALSAQAPAVPAQPATDAQINLLLSSFARACKYGTTEQRIACGDAIKAALSAQAPAVPSFARPCLTLSVRWVEKRREDFDAQHGSLDPDTGAFEYGSGTNAEAKREYSAELSEIADGLRTLAAAPQAAQPSEEQKSTVLSYLDALKDDAAAHIWPDDLERCSQSECTVTVTSFRMGSPEGSTVPLFTREQVSGALDAARAQQEKSNA